MKSKFLIITFLITSSMAFCQSIIQTKSPLGRKLFSIEFGYSNPLGNYGASSSLNNGYAYGGSTLHLEYTNYKCKNVGWTVLLSAANHNVMHERVQERLNSNLSQNAPNYSIQNNEAKWMSTTLMGGLAYSVSCGKFMLETKAYGGFFFGKNPNLTFISGESAVPKFENKEAECVGTLGIQAKSSLSYAVSPKIALKLSSSYYYANPEYKKEIKIAEVPTTYSFHQQISVVEFAFGISYNFRKNNP